MLWPWHGPRPTAGYKNNLRSTLVSLFVFQFLCLSEASPQWSNPNDFYSNSYQFQHGFVPSSIFGASNQYGISNSNFGAFNRPFMPRPNSFVPYGNNYGGTVSGSPAAGGGLQTTSHVESSDETPPHTGSSIDATHPSGAPGGSLNPESMSGMGRNSENMPGLGRNSENMPGMGRNSESMPGIGRNSESMPGMGSQVGGTDSTTHSPSSPPGSGTSMQQMTGGGSMNSMNQMGMNGMNEMMANGYRTGMTNNNNGGMMNQWPANMNMGMNNFGGNCYGPGCAQNFQGGPSMNPNGFDYQNAGMGSNIGQNVGAEDYNSIEDSGELTGGDGIEQANLQRYAEYLNLVNRRYGIRMPGQTPNVINQQTSNTMSTVGGSPQGTGSFNGMGIGTLDMNGGMMSNFMGGMTNMGLPNMGISNMGISNMGGLTTMESISNGIPIGATSSGITGGVSSPIPTNNLLASNTPVGTGMFVGRLSTQSPIGFGSGLVGYGGYLPSIYESSYPIQWPISSTGYGSGTLTNLASGANGMGIMDGYGPTGSMPAEYMGMSTMPYGYAGLGMQYPMSTQVYPQTIMPAIYQGVTSPGQIHPTVSPEMSRSREKSSQESSATSREHIQSPPPATSIQALTQQIRRLPAVLYVDSKDNDGRHVENLLRDTYGLPLVSFYVDKIDKPRVVEKYLHQLTAHKGLPYLFICGTFIGSQEHVENYHKNKQIPQLVEYVCGEEKDKKNSSQRQSSHKDKKKKSNTKRHSKPRNQSTS